MCIYTVYKTHSLLLFMDLRFLISKDRGVHIFNIAIIHICIIETQYPLTCNCYLRIAGQKLKIPLLFYFFFRHSVIIIKCKIKLKVSQKCAFLKKRHMFLNLLITSLSLWSQLKHYCSFFSFLMAVYFLIIFSMQMIAAKVEWTCSRIN